MSASEEKVGVPALGSMLIVVARLSVVVVAQRGPTASVRFRTGVVVAANMVAFSARASLDE